MFRSEIQKKEVWDRLGSNFMVQVKHWNRGHAYPPHDLGHRWNVYAYVFRGHPLFDKINPDAEYIWEHLPAKPDLWLHGGITFFEPLFERQEAGVYSIVGYKFGSDYAHGGDAQQGLMESDMHELPFWDAELLYDQLKAMVEKEWEEES